MTGAGPTDAEPTRIVVLGRIGAPFAVQGWLKVKSYTEPRENLLDYQIWHVGNEGKWQVMKVEAGRTSMKDVLVKLSGIDNPEIARTLTGLDVGVAREALPALSAGEYYWDDLLQMEVYSAQGELLGRLDHFAQTAAHGLLVIRAQVDDSDQESASRAREILVPMVRERVLGIDREAGRITLDWQRDWS
jgi:16S rRNA processing protein RimM